MSALLKGGTIALRFLASILPRLRNAVTICAPQWAAILMASLQGRECAMSCKSCHSECQSHFNGEIAIHFPGLKGLDNPIVWVFPKLVVCLDCGFTEFVVPEAELRVLRNGTDSSTAA